MVVSVCYAGSTGGWGLGVASGTRAAAAGNNSDWWKLAFPDTLQEDTQ